MNVQRAGQVRATQMNRSRRKRHSSCADEEVYSNLVTREIKTLLTRSASLEIALYRKLTAGLFPAGRASQESRRRLSAPLGFTDTAGTTYLYVRSIGLIVAGDAAYNGVHLQALQTESTENVRRLSACHAVHSASSVHGRKSSALRFDHRVRTAISHEWLDRPKE
jgi:hypothetical protein